MYSVVAASSLPFWDDYISTTVETTHSSVDTSSATKIWCVPRKCLSVLANGSAKKGRLTVSQLLTALYENVLTSGPAYARPMLCAAISGRPNGRNK